jgi:hypothetical protein
MNLTRWRAALGAVLRKWGPIGRIATHAQPGQDLRMHLCRCSVCSVVRRCTPDFDFYAEHARGPLICHDCFFRRVLLDAMNRPI